MGSPSLAHLALGHPLVAAFVVPTLHALLVALLGALPVGGSVCQLLYVTISCIMAAWHAVRKGPTVWISNTVSISCAADTQDCSRFLQETSNLGQYEQKLTGCRVWGQHERGCKTQLWGWWWVLPFCKTFEISYNKDGGFHAALDENGWESIVPACLSLRGGGGFKIQKSDDKHTKLIHYERYGWPIAFPLIWLFDYPWNAWHRRGMEVEMEVIRAQLEEIQQLQASLGGAVAANPPHTEQKEGAAASPPSAAVAELFPPHTWTAWKYGALHYLSEILHLQDAAVHPRVRRRTLSCSKRRSSCGREDEPNAAPDDACSEPTAKKMRVQ